MLMQALQLGMGALGAYGAYQQRQQRDRIEEQYNKDAYGGLLQTRDAINNMNPQATGNAALSHISDAQSAAMASAANVGAGQAAASGLGGDVSSGQISSLKAAQPLGQVAAQFGAQKAQVEQNVFNDQATQNQQMGDVNTRLSNLSDKVNYQYMNKPTLLQALTGGVLGVNGGTNVAELLTGKGGPESTNTNPNEAIQQQSNTGASPIMAPATQDLSTPAGAELPGGSGQPANAQQPQIGEIPGLKADPTKKPQTLLNALWGNVFPGMYQ